MFSASDSSSEMDCTKAEIEKKRWSPKRSSQRGPYSKAAKNDTKLCIIAAAENNSDWKAAARANGVPIERMKLPRNAGNTNKIKINWRWCWKNADIRWGEPPLITLTEFKSIILNELDIIISTSTIHKYLEFRLYTAKKSSEALHHELCIHFSSQPHSKGHFSSQPHSKGDFSSQPHSKGDFSSQPHSKGHFSPQPNSKGHISSQPHSKASGQDVIDAQILSIMC